MTAGPMGMAIAVTARKYDGGAHLTWPARLLLADDDLLLAYAPPGMTLVHHTKGLRLPQEHACLSAFPRHRHWNAMLDFAPDGRWLGAYCNVALPPTLAGDRLDWVDLDLDVVRAGDGPATLVDEDEFIAHAARYAYPPSARRRTNSSRWRHGASRHSFPRTGTPHWRVWPHSCGAMPCHNRVGGCNGDVPTNRIL